MYRLILLFGLFSIISPGSSRGDIAYLSTNGGNAAGSTSALSKFQFRTGSNSGFLVDSIQVFGNNANATFTSLQFKLYNSGGTELGSYTAANTVNQAGSTFALSNFGLSALTADTTYQFGIAATFASGQLEAKDSIYLDYTGDNTVFNNTFFATHAGQWIQGDQIKVVFAASVPEPTTMILTGSVIAAGFGASLLRRFRKKQASPESAT